jgi:hypothetical protein
VSVTVRLRSVRRSCRVLVLPGILRLYHAAACQ